MRAGIITGLRTLELQTLAEPTPTEGRAVVEVARCGICGSDVHAYAEGWQYAPSLCGHEWYGTVAGVGKGVTSVKEGDMVVGGRAPGCGSCEACVVGLPEYCKPAFLEYSGLGPNASANGGFAPMLELDARRVQAMPEKLTLEQGAMVEPACVAFHAVRRSAQRPGDVVAVVGAGPIGQMTAQCARAAGAGVVAIIEPDEARRQRAIDLGADVGFAPGDEAKQGLRDLTNKLGADVAFDAAGVPQTLEASIDLVRRGGAVCMVGVAGDAATLRTNKWMMKEIRIDTSLAFTHEEMAMVGGMIADGRLNVAAMHDGTITLDELAETIDQLADRKLDALKILVDPTAG